MNSACVHSSYADTATRAECRVRVASLIGAAYHGSDNIIHLINIRASQLGLSIDKALWAKWFIAGGSSAPTEFPFGGTKVLYAKIGQDEPTPMIQAIVEKIDAASAMKQIEWLMKTLIQRQPEMVLDNIDAVSGQSGETIAKLFTPVQSRILTARQQYEHPLIDAIRIAAVVGNLDEEMGLGNGNGNARSRRPCVPVRGGELQFQRPTSTARDIVRHR